MKLSSSLSETIIASAARIARKIAESPLLSFLLLLLGAFSVAVGIWYWSATFLLAQEQYGGIETIQFREKQFLEIVEIWKTRKTLLQSAPEKELKDLFAPSQ